MEQNFSHQSKVKPRVSSNTQSRILLIHRKSTTKESHSVLKVLINRVRIMNKSMSSMMGSGLATARIIRKERSQTYLQEKLKIRRCKSTSKMNNFLKRNRYFLIRWSNSAMLFKPMRELSKHNFNCKGLWLKRRI